MIIYHFQSRGGTFYICRYMYAICIHVYVHCQAYHTASRYPPECITYTRQGTRTRRIHKQIHTRTHSLTQRHTHRQTHTDVHPHILTRTQQSTHYTHTPIHKSTCTRTRLLEHPNTSTETHTNTHMHTHAHMHRCRNTRTH